MKKLGTLMIVTCIILTGCGKTKQENVDINQKSLAITQPTLEITKETSFVVTSTSTQVISSRTPLPLQTPTKTSAPLDDRIVSQPTHTRMPDQECQEISIEDYSSIQGIKGVIPLQSTTNKLMDSYFMDLETEQKVSFPNSQADYFSVQNNATSPDGKWLAYIPIMDIHDQMLVIVNSKGEVEKKIFLANIIYPVHSVSIEGWIDNEQIILVWPIDNSIGLISPDQAITVILNPFTGEWYKFKPEFPDIFTRYPDIYYVWNMVSLSEYNQSLDRVLYLSYDGVVLWDLLNQKQIKLFNKAPDYSSIQPAWSPDGSSFVIDLDTENGRNLFLVSKDGDTKQITFMKGYQSNSINNFSWSSDGEYIAFWLFERFYNQEIYNFHDLSILNLSTQEMDTFCINAYNWRKSFSDWYPIWSPDEKYLVVAAVNENDLTRSMAVLVDLANERAYKIADDVIPVGWMVSE